MNGYHFSNHSRPAAPNSTGYQGVGLLNTATSATAVSPAPLLSPNLDLHRLSQLGIESPERIRSVPIRDVRVGVRVPAHNPQITDAQRTEMELGIDPDSWVKVQQLGLELKP